MTKVAKKLLFFGKFVEGEPPNFISVGDEGLAVLDPDLWARARILFAAILLTYTLG